MNWRALMSVALLSVALGSPQRLWFKPDGTFKLLHISDTHYEIGPATSCQDVSPGLPCSQSNTTGFISRLIAEEQPDLVVHTGDIVDWATHPAAAGMAALYGVPIEARVPWAATLGNHDAQSDLNRSAVMQYVVQLPGALSELNPLGEGPNEAFGNFVLELFNHSGTRPSFRSYHLDSNANPSSISPAQVKWYADTARALNAAAPAPALAFFHIPLQQYDTAARAGNISGHWNEAVSYNGNNSDLFSALQSAGDVKATFCGHDHTNDFCAAFQGIQLCYEGSPGYQAYGKLGWPRRARVTQIERFGSRVSSWKRLDGPSMRVLDKEVLWERANPELSFAHRKPSGVPAPELLPRRSQPGHVHEPR